jgi:hypothetical protein
MAGGLSDVVVGIMAGKTPRDTGTGQQIGKGEKG